MRYLRITLSGMALVFGLMILAISFSAANSALSASEPIENSRKQFYMGERILPDHVAYPALMAMDRTKLELATPQDRILIQAAYAQRRFEYTLALLEKNNSSLAITTLTKSQKYLIAASLAALEQNSSDAVKMYLYRSLIYYQAQMEQLKPAFDDNDRPVIDALIDQSAMLSLQLIGSLTDPDKIAPPTSSSPQE